VEGARPALREQVNSIQWVRQWEKLDLAERPNSSQAKSQPGNCFGAKRSRTLSATGKAEFLKGSLETASRYFADEDGADKNQEAKRG
jgi:hypothetical protein